jgi:hypothetical protein
LAGEAGGGGDEDIRQFSDTFWAIAAGQSTQTDRGGHPAGMIVYRGADGCDALCDVVQAEHIALAAGAVHIFNERFQGVEGERGQGRQAGASGVGLELGVAQPGEQRPRRGAAVQRLLSTDPQ